MNKGLVKRSQFILAQLTTGIFKQVIEADEAYIMQTQPSVCPAMIRRQREKDFAGFLTANPTLGGTNTNQWGVLDPSFGRVPLDVPITLDGNLLNRPITTAVNSHNDMERVYHAQVGFKEVIEIKPQTDGAQISVIIELVHYVPADQIAA